MVARLRIVVLAALFLVLLACSARPRFLLYIDPYSAELLAQRIGPGAGFDLPWMREIEELFRDAADVRVQIPSAGSGPDPKRPPAGKPAADPSVGTEQFEQLAEILRRRNPDWVYLSPALDIAPAQVIEQFPETIFLREGYAGSGPANLVTVVYQRATAHRRAGEALGKLIGEPEFRARIGSPGPNQSDLRVGILVAVSNDQLEIEIEEFRQGLSLFTDAQPIERKDIGNLTDRVKARRLLEKMKEQGVAIILLKTYTLSSYCLEFLQKEGGLAVVEDALAASAFKDTVLLALEDDFIGALLKVKELVMESPRPHLETAKTVEAPVRLIWGKPYSELAGRLLAGVVKP